MPTRRAGTLRGHLAVDGLASPGRRRHQLRAAPGEAVLPEGGGKAGLDLPDVSDGPHGVHPVAQRQRAPRHRPWCPVPHSSAHSAPSRSCPRSTTSRPSRQRAEPPEPRHPRHRALRQARVAEIASSSVLTSCQPRGCIGFVSKGQKQRSVTLPPQALEIVRPTWPAQPGPAAPIPTRRCSARRTDRRRAQLPRDQPCGNALDAPSSGRPPHPAQAPPRLWQALRHRGVDIRIIAEALGHESLESTKIYTQVSFERTRRIAELFALPGCK